MSRIQTKTIDGVGSTDWILTDLDRNPFNLGVFVTLDGGSMDYTVEYTCVEKPNGVIAPPVFDLGTGSDEDYSDNIIVPVTGVRLTVDTYTSGEAVLTIIQAGDAS